MKTQLLAALMTGALLMPAAAGAQDRDSEVYSFGEGHGRIGVMVNMAPDQAVDKLGARIQSVIPGGPAAEAGLEAGDIITRFDGKALGGVASDDEDRSGPAARLVELARKLDPGDEVKIEYRRGDESRTATLTADDMGNTFSFSWPRGGDHVRPRFDFDPDFLINPRHGDQFRGMRFFFNDGMGGLELQELNPDLGEYFGTKDGALVLSAPTDSTLALKGGDVIVAIDGRKVQSPSHARRILRSYNAGETAKIEIVRHQRKQTVAWTVPEHLDSFHFRQQRGPHKARMKSESRA